MISFREYSKLRYPPRVYPDAYVKVLAAKPWPPLQWKGDLENSIQMRRFGLFEPYLYLEDSMGVYEDRKSLMSLEDYEECKNFFRVIRESRGYDLQSFPSCIADWVSRALVSIPLDLVRSCQSLFQKETDRALEWINGQAMWHGEVYEFGEYVNVVRSNLRHVTLYTFTVKKVGDGEVRTAQAMLSCGHDGSLSVEEWRFKPM